MASYHCTVKAGGKGQAGKHADYVAREGKYSPELTRGASKLEDLEHKASGNMPAWAAHDAGVFWKAADEHERANGATYREIEVALPRELTPDQRRELVEDFIQKQIGERHPFTYAIHIPQAAIEKGEQPHAHIMYSERTLDGIARDPDQFFKRANTKDPEKGGCKKASGGKLRAERKAELLEIRELWADVQNKHLEKAGVDERVTHLSLKAQGIERTPEMHLGPVLARQHAPALREHRAAERELAQTPRVDAAAELALQAAREAAAQAQARQDARETFRQVQAAEQARLQAQAQQAAQQAREAAAQAQARQDARETFRQVQAAEAARRQAQAQQAAQQAQAQQQAREAREAAAAAAQEAARQAQADQEAKEAAEAKAKAKAAARQAAEAAAQQAPSPFDGTGLQRRDDLALAARAKELFSQDKPDGYSRYMLSQDLSKAMSAAVREIRDTEPRHASADAERTIKAEQNADARRAGQPEPWKAEQTACAWDTMAFRLDRERREHLETKRPSGMFSGAAGKEYDAKTASLTSQIDNITRAAVTLKAELQAKLAEKAQEAAQRGPQHTAAKERYEGLTRLHKAVGEAVKQIEANEPQIERDNDHGNDLGR